MVSHHAQVVHTCTSTGAYCFDAYCFDPPESGFAGIACSDPPPWPYLDPMRQHLAHFKLCIPPREPRGLCAAGHVISGANPSLNPSERLTTAPAHSTPSIGPAPRYRPRSSASYSAPPAEPGVEAGPTGGGSDGRHLREPRAPLWWQSFRYSNICSNTPKVAPPTDKRQPRERKTQVSSGKTRELLPRTGPQHSRGTPQDGCH